MQSKLPRLLVTGIWLYLMSCFSFAENYLSDYFTIGERNYKANSLSVALDLSKIVSIIPGYTVYYSSYTTRSYFIDITIKTNEKSNLNFNFLSYPEVENYKSNLLGLSFQGEIKNTKLKIGYSNTKHQQNIYRPIREIWEWFELNQSALNLSIRQKVEKVNLSVAYTDYSYDKDLEKISLAYRYFRLRNIFLEDVNSLISGFSKNSIDFGITYDLSKYFLTSFNYTVTNYELDQTESNSYLLGLIFYPNDTLEILTEYNNFDNINYYTFGFGYYLK